MTLGEKIYTLRTQRGRSQEELAEEIGVSRQTVSNWETDKVRPDTEKVVLMCKFFSVSADYLLFDVNVQENDVAAQNGTRSKTEDALPKVNVINTHSIKKPNPNKVPYLFLSIFFGTVAVIMAAVAMVASILTQGEAFIISYSGEDGSLIFTINWAGALVLMSAVTLVVFVVFLYLFLRSRKLSHKQHTEPEIENLTTKKK